MIYETKVGKNEIRKGRYEKVTKEFQKMKI